MILRTTIAALLCASSAAAQGWLTPPDAPPENPVTAEKAVLGKALFWDEQLSSDGSVACGTCHIPSVGGGDPRLGASTIHPGLDGVFGTADDATGSPGVVRASAFGHFTPSTSFGLDPQVTRRQAPSPSMAGYYAELFWDGRAKSRFVDPLSGALVIASGGALESQSLGPILSDVEMADEGRGWDDVTSRLESVSPLALADTLPADVDAALAVDPTYPELFERAFGSPDITPVRIAFALATYQRTLVADESPFDEFMRGDQNALTPQQRRGMFAFETTAICAVCHTPPTFQNDQFHALALRPSVEDLGRFEVTNDPADRGRFKVPSLRNASLRNRWFHHGPSDITSLHDAVAFYQFNGPVFDNLDAVFNGFTLTNGEVDDITAFIEGLTDPRVAAELPPFDRPRLRSERAVPNPRLLGVGGVAGALGEPRVILEPAPFVGADRFRLGLEGARPGGFAAVRLRLVDPGGFAGAGGALALRQLPLPTAARCVQDGGPGIDGHATWSFDLTASPALLGVVLDARWLVRDATAPGGVASSDVVRITIE